MILPCVGLVVFGLLVAGCTGGDSVVSSDTTSGGDDASAVSVERSSMTTGGSACEWLSVDTVEWAVAAAVAEPPVEPTEDVWSCIWRGSDAELSIRFDRFANSGRSVEAELGRIGGYAYGGLATERLVTVEGLRGAFQRPGVWYGETPLQQYGMMTIRLTHLDRTEPDLVGFEAVVAAVIEDVTATDPAVPG